MKTTVHPLDLPAIRMLATDLRLLSGRAERLGVPSAAATVELVSDMLERLHEREFIEQNAAAARRS